jgi:hypothetical protein
MTFAKRCDHFEQRELAKDKTWHSYSTRTTYGVYLKQWVVPHWGRYELSAIKTIQVESWLRRLPLAKSSCAKIRNVMSVLLITPVDMSFLTAIRFAWSGKARNAEPVRACSNPSKSGP